MWGRIKATFSQAKIFQVGDRVALHKVDLGPQLEAWKNQLVGTVVSVPSDQDVQPYVVDIFAPVVGEEEAMNPILARFSVEGLCASQLSSATARNCGLTALGRKNSSFCSVPLAELHARGCGHRTHGRSARLGGLAKRPDLEGLTGTVIAGPDRQGQYCLKMMLEEGELDTVTADAENITLRVRRGALAELVLQGTQVDAKEPSIPDRPSEGVPFLAALYHDVKLPGKGSEGRKDGEKTADSKPNAEKLVNKAHVRRPSPSPREAEDLRPPRPSRLVSLSPQAAVALVAAGDVPEHAITEAWPNDPTLKVSLAP